MAEDIKTEFRTITDPGRVLFTAWETSTKNAAARSYLAGMIDAMLWSRTITPVTAEAAYIRYVQGDAQA